MNTLSWQRVATYCMTHSRMVHVAVRWNQSLLFLRSKIWKYYVKRTSTKSNIISLSQTNALQPGPLPAHSCTPDPINACNFRINACHFLGTTEGASQKCRRCHVKRTHFFLTYEPTATRPFPSPTIHFRLNQRLQLLRINKTKDEDSCQENIN